MNGTKLECNGFACIHYKCIRNLQVTFNSEFMRCVEKRFCNTKSNFVSQNKLQSVNVIYECVPN